MKGGEVLAKGEGRREGKEVPACGRCQGEVEDAGKVSSFEPSTTYAWCVNQSIADESWNRVLDNRKRCGTAMIGIGRSSQPASLSLPFMSLSGIPLASRHSDRA